MNKRFFAALGTVVIGVGAMAGIGTYVASAKNDSRVLAATAAGTMVTSQGTLPHYTLDISAYPDSMFGGHSKDGGAHPDWVSYGPVTNFQVPAHSAITITVTNYDGGETLNNDFFGKIRGTIDGSATLNGTRITRVAPDHVGHTFTVHGVAGGQSELFFSVPMQAVAEADMPDSGYTAKPNVTVFTVITGNAGEYVWNCEYPCGDGTIAKFGNAMSSMGYMSGHFNVVKA
jgi:uncharacterized protein YaiE (UPF0345 family)